MRHKLFGLLLCMVLVMVALPIGRAQVAAQDPTNLTADCVETFDPTVDYFPAKAEFEYAQGVTVEYFNNYRVVNVLPYAGAENPFQYVLVQCGTPTPEGFDDAQIIETPIQNIVALSTVYLPHLITLGVEDSLLAVDEFDYVNSPEIRTKINAGVIDEIGGGGTVNIELALDLEPDVVLTYASGSAEYDAHPILLDAGIPVVVTSEYLDTSALAQAEWIKLTAMLYNREAEATEFFDGLVERYTSLVELAATVEEKPTVMVNTPFSGTWYVAGGDSYLGNLLADAGADYLWADDASAQTIPLGFEEVLDKAKDADFWVNVLFWDSLETGIAEDERFVEFAPFENGNVWAVNKAVNEFGGNDYFEAGVTNPDLILADLIAIFHPELLPDHEFRFYRRLE